MANKAIILAAGMGTRLKPLTDKHPKCMTQVNGKSIIKNALEVLSKNGFEETVIVVGYLSSAIMEYVGDSVGGMKITYVENPIFSQTNTGYSLQLGLEIMEQFDSLFILEGDVFFEDGLLKAMLTAPDENLTALEKYNPTLDGSFVELDENDYVIDWVHKKNRTSDYVVETKFKTVNIHKFDKDFVETKLKPVLGKQNELYSGNVPIEDVMREIVTGDTTLVKGFEVGTLKWFEIDDIEDLRRAEEIFS